MNEPMDIYSSDMSIPFDIAAYCRGRKFSVEAVNLARALQERHIARNKLKVAEDNLAFMQQCVESAMVSVRQKMERDPV